MPPFTHHSVGEIRYKTFVIYQTMQSQLGTAVKLTRSSDWVQIFVSQILS